MDEESRALEMREELMAEAGDVRCTLDQARHVGHGELPCVRPSTTPSTGSSVVNG